MYHKYHERVENIHVTNADRICHLKKNWNLSLVNDLLRTLSFFWKLYYNTKRIEIVVCAEVMCIKRPTSIFLIPMHCIIYSLPPRILFKGDRKRLKPPSSLIPKYGTE